MAATNAIEFESKTLRDRGVKAASAFLERRGFEILESGYTCDAGTVDIVAKDDEDTIVFIEVNVYDVTSAGMPDDAVDADKRRRLEIIAGSYLAASDANDVTVRFDILSILVIGNDRALIRHHLNVFGF